MLLYALTILVSAFLLFQVQPIIARTILPWFGGSSAVWTACLLFFQTVLLLGYLYAHWLYRRLTPRLQALAHILLLVASVAALPISPAASWKPTASEDPTFQILLLLAATVGLPYFLLSTTGPLLQAWYSRQFKGAVPYRLYALSNAGSMFALVSYPVLFEPLLGTRSQAVSWSWAYGAFILLCGITAFSVRNAYSAPVAEDTDAERPSKSTYLFWIGLPACASVLLLAITNYLSQNIAAIPFLWILPLSLYLLSFILCFEGTRWYRRNVFLGLFAVAGAGLAYALGPDSQNGAIKVMIPFFAACLFIFCMVCHGELVRLKPHPSRLTTFYVMIALGGALGGVFVAIVAPRMFSGFYELPLGLAACMVLVFMVLRADPQSGLAGPWLRPAPLGAAVLTLAIAGYTGFLIQQRGRDVRVLVRNFYGGLKVVDATADDDDSQPIRRLTHGTITHGEQYLDPRFQGRAHHLLRTEHRRRPRHPPTAAERPHARGRDRTGDRHSGRLRPSRATTTESTISIRWCCASPPLSLPSSRTARPAWKSRSATRACHSSANRPSTSTYWRWTPFRAMPSPFTCSPAKPSCCTFNI
jgi:MFS family permease